MSWNFVSMQTSSAGAEQLLVWAAMLCADQPAGGAGHHAALPAAHVLGAPAVAAHSKAPHRCGLRGMILRASLSFPCMLAPPAALEVTQQHVLFFCCSGAWRGGAAEPAAGQDPQRQSQLRAGCEVWLDCDIVVV